MADTLTKTDDASEGEHVIATPLWRIRLRLFRRSFGRAA